MVRGFALSALALAALCVVTHAVAIERAIPEKPEGVSIPAGDRLPIPVDVQGTVDKILGSVKGIAGLGDNGRHLGHCKDRQPGRGNAYGHLKHDCEGEDSEEQKATSPSAEATSPSAEGSGESSQEVSSAPAEENASNSAEEATTASVPESVEVTVDGQTDGPSSSEEVTIA